MVSPFYIFIPRKFWPENLPTSPDENWPGFGLGMYTWTIQTYLRLNAIAFPCQLTHELPEEGIILVDHNHLRMTRLRPNQRQFIVCLKQDGLHYPYAQCHVVQNLQDAQHRAQYHYIPHWPQPGLVQRHPARGDRFENIAFFGHQVNLAPELQQPTWQKTLANIGLNWCSIANQNHWSEYKTLNSGWNDYSQVDAIVAVRAFGKRQRFLNKPATKLYNAWLASVPAILGYELAFRREGTPGLNYLEATSPEALLQALKTLKQNLSLRQQLITQGQAEGQKFTASKTVHRWRTFLEKAAFPAFESWCRIPRSLQVATLERNWLSHKFVRGTTRLSRLLSNF